MAEFRKKIVGATSTLGEKFRQLREEAGFSLETAASRTKVNVKHLRAIEDGRYAELPGVVYAKNFVRAYANLLEVSEETALDLFEHEYRVVTKVAPTPPQHQPEPRTLLTPQNIRRAGILLLAAAVLVYLGTELRNLTSAPSLDIISPPEQLTTNAAVIELRGTTDPETTVTANGKVIMVDRQGGFREVLDLKEGLNTVMIRAVKKRGGTTTVTRNILVEPQT